MSVKSKVRNKKRRAIKKPEEQAWKTMLRILGLQLPAHTWVRRIFLGLMASVVLFFGGMYGIAQWYIHKHRNETLRVGATFTTDYAKHFGLDPEETLQAIIDELAIKHLRLVSYWDKGEPTENIYNFDELDWQFKIAEQRGVKVSLAIGLRQPRWPECHMPKWAEQLPMEQWEPKLMNYTKAVMERYKNSPALESYQLENEFFLDVFGICPDHSRDRLIREYEFVKKVDPEHKVIISRSNNAIGLPVGKPTPDEFAISVYKRVWDKNATMRYYEYPFPAWFYASLAGGGEILTGKNMIVHELQTEAWLPETNKNEFQMNSIDSIPEQNKSLNAERLRERIRYGEATGMKTVDLWGVEWWYWRKIKANDPSLWNIAKTEINRINTENTRLESN